ncbi:hypothetical protein ACEOHC_003865 [Salmonella enterica]
MKLSILSLLSALLLTTSVHAGTPKNHVNCDVIADSTLQVYMAHYPKKPDSSFSPKLFRDHLLAYCHVGVGSWMQGESLDKAVQQVANAELHDTRTVAAEISAMVQGYVYQSSGNILAQDKGK